MTGRVTSGLGRLLLVHAHPDDEVTSTGATIALYSSQGVVVTLVTCTRGELGEVVAGDLAELAATDPSWLPKHREIELAEALRILGVERHHWLGGLGRWHDSGMAGTADNAAPGAFAAADPAAAMREMVAILRAERPHVVVTYDPTGGYGHPDHIQAHRVTMAALGPAADPDYAPELGEPWEVARLYWPVLPRSFMEAAVRFGVFGSIEEAPTSIPDDEVDVVIDGRHLLETKRAAFAAYRSQVDLTEGVFSALISLPEFAVEHYHLAAGVGGGSADDLFAGLELA